MEGKIEEEKDGERTEPPMGGSREKSKRGGRRRYSPEFRLKAVKLYLKGGHSLSVLCQEMGMDKNSLFWWVKRYKESGAEGLRDRPNRGPRTKRLAAPIAEKILELKREHPGFGVERLSQLLRRWFFLSASPGTVRQRLQEAQLMPPTKKKKERNLTRPRFFERATPNQMWQSDIFTFRLGGRYAYLIAYLDDYSRYLVGADLFRSPTAEAVIEVYRVAMGEFKPPQEMLTDNGRQYTSWRGTSRFEAELKKDRVAHIKSRPHHPMTLGKIERFWSSIWQEFLVRVQFESFDAARERIKLWIKYYNHKRPHQGLGGLCPADRFFEIQTELRKTIEAGIKENLLELALRGKPQAPFYMVGRMDGQSVVLRAEKGKLKLSVTNDQNQSTQELTYDLHQDPAQQRPAHGPQPSAQTQSQPGLLGPGESPSGPGGLDRPGTPGGHLPPAAHQLGDLPAVADPGHGRDAPSPGEPGEPGPGGSLEPASAGAAAKAEPGPLDRAPERTLDPTPAVQGCQAPGDRSIIPAHEQPGSASPSAGLAHPAGADRPDHRHGGGPATGPVPQELLPVGETSPGGAGPIPGATSPGPTAQGKRPGEGTVAAAGDATGREDPPTGAGHGTSASGAEAPGERR